MIYDLNLDTEPETKRKEAQSLSHSAEQLTENKEPMEEKELDLTQLLKGCKGIELYSTVHGKCKLSKIYDNNNNGSQPLINVKLENSTSCNYTPTGKINWSVEKFAPISLFPSRTLYEKYPLDAKKAWDEWCKSRKPKRWRAEYGDTYYRLRYNFIVCDQYEINDSVDNESWDNYNYFRTKEEAQQAAEAVRECLEKFHKDHATD